MKNEIIILFLLIMLPVKVGAYIPVTYSCCYNYTSSDGVQLDNFENIVSSNGPLDGIQLEGFENLSNWTVGGTLGYSQDADTVNFKEGIQGLKLVAKYGNITPPSWNRTYSDKVINNNFSTTNNFGVWIYVYNVSTVSEITLYFTSTGTWSSKYFTDHITGLSSGWNKLIINKSNFISTNGESWNNVMTRMRIAVVPKTGQNTNVTFDDFRYNVNTGNWVVGGAGAFQEVDTINFREGNQGLKLVATNGNSAYIDKVINENFLNNNNFAIWVYVDNASNFYRIDLYITSNGSNWNTFFFDTQYNGFETGWNRLVFNRHNFKNTGGENWNNVMNKIRLRIWPKETANLNVSFDDLRRNITGQRAKLIIEFDDGSLSTYNRAYPILDANNQSGVSWVITSWIGSATDMNLTNLRTLQSAGWDISSHTVDHSDLTSLEDTNLISELNDSYSWLVTNNFQKSAGFVAYPYGKFNDNVLDKVRLRYVLGRATVIEPSQQHFAAEDDAGRYIQRIVYVYNSTTVQSIEDYINDTINAKLLGILTFHNIVDSNPTNYLYMYLTSDFQLISNYIKSRKDDVDVVTYSDYVIPNINSFTPVINKTTRIFSNGSSVLITKNKYDEYMPNMTVEPLSGSIDIDITEYNETGGLIKFNESGHNNLQASYDIGDRIPNQLYRIIIYWFNGIKYQDFNVLADSAGHIRYNSVGFENSRYQEINIIPRRSSFNIVYNII